MADERRKDTQATLARFAVMMVGTSDAANIGAVCRAMKNFGTEDLVLVAPRTDEPTGDRAQALAVGAADLLDSAVIAPTMEEGAERAGIDYFAATSARLSSVRGPFVSPEQFAAEAWPLMQQGRRVALVLGPEDTGLVNEDIAKCRWKINIPTSGFSSLNVAQAGLIVLYAMRRHAYPGFVDTRRLRTASEAKRAAARTPAGPMEIESLMEMFRTLFARINFAWRTNPDKMVRPFREIFLRAEVTQREVGILMSFVRRAMYALGDRSMTRRARLEREARERTQEGDRKDKE